MTSFPNSPRLLKGGIVLIDPDTGAVQRIIALQYNPDTLTRSSRASSLVGFAPCAAWARWRRATSVRNSSVSLRLGRSGTLD